MAETSTRVRLRVSPGARRSELVGRHGDGWKVRVTAPPEDGRANDAVLDLLAESVSTCRGDRSRSSPATRPREKVVRLEGIGRAESERRLEGALA